MNRIELEKIKQKNLVQLIQLIESTESHELLIEWDSRYFEKIRGYFNPEIVL